MGRAFYLLILIILLPCALHAQVPFMRDFWLNEAGTAIKVNTIIRSATGSIWAGTEQGLYRFNGRSFTPVQDTVHQSVTALAIATDGGLWVGHDNGILGKLEGNEVHPYYINGIAPAAAVTSILEPQEGLLVLGTDAAGICIIAGHNGMVLNTANGLYDDYVYETLVSQKGGELLAATDQGINIVRVKRGKIAVERIGTQSGLPDNIVRVLRHVPGTEMYWAGTQDNGVALYNHKTRSAFTPAMRTPWQWGQINDLIVQSGKLAWAGTEDGYLLRLELHGDSMQVEPYNLNGKKIAKITADPSGNIWCATNTGLSVVSAAYAVQLYPPGSFMLKNVTAMECDTADVLWYAQGNKLLSLPADSSGQQHALTAPASVTCLYTDKHGHMWVGTFGKGLLLCDGDRLLPVRNIPDLLDGHILDVTGTADRLWVASLNGVDELQLDAGGKLAMLKHHDKHAGIGSDYVYQLYTSRKGEIWMATDGGGVCMYDGNRYHRWDSLSGMQAAVAYSVTEDAAGYIWAGTLDHGMYRFDGKKWMQMQRGNGLQDMTVLSVAANDYGQVVAVDQRGIDLWYPADNQFRHFNRRINMEIDSLSSALNCIAADKKGNIYVPFDRGFIRFGRQDNPGRIIPSVNIISLSVFLKPVHEQHKTKFSSSENYISFRFEGVNLVSPERLFYRYKLEGYNNNWLVTADESVTYPQLPPGKYTFRVQASLSSNFHNPAEAKYAFTIATPVWKRGWFIASITAVVVGLGYLYLRFRERRLRKLSLLQRERMVFEYEHLKSQVNPHFLFNSLNTLVNLIDEDQEMAIRYTEQLSDLYRNMLAYRDQDLILLKDEWSLLEKYFYIQQNRFGQALQWEVNIPPQIMQTARIVPLALQLLVENAIKHNIVSRTVPLMIRIEADAEKIKVANRYNPKQSKEVGAGLGLVNIKKRYALLTRKTVDYGIDGNQYIVTLPLL
jgi:ligand-binding sensor domain-containing protein/uncharacterized membrane-anchored protein YhcB (DUF1043 family)